RALWAVDGPRSASGPVGLHPELTLGHAGAFRMERDLATPTPTRSLDGLLGPLRRMLSELMRSEALEKGDAKAALMQLTEAAAAPLNGGGAGVGRFAFEPKRLVCIDLFERGPRRHDGGTVLFAEATPAYFAALDTERSIAAHDAMSDLRT